MSSLQSILDLYGQARQANLADPLRRGQVLEFPAAGEVVMTGDLHGHEGNFEKIVRFTALAGHPRRHLVLHELIHEPQATDKGDFSFRLLERVLRLQMAFPGRVHSLLGNHALSQVFNRPLAGAGGDAVQFLRQGLAEAYGPEAGEVHRVMADFLLSEPLATRLPNGIMLSHSLPSPGKMGAFDPQILFKDRLDRPDLESSGSAYLLVWGRRQTAAQLEQLARVWGVDLFITGHQPQEMGFARANPRQLILASDHNHGCCLPIDLSRKYTIQALADSVVKLAGVE